MKKVLIIFVSLFAAGALSAQNIPLDEAGRDAEYVKNIIKRAEKVTNELNIRGTAEGT